MIRKILFISCLSAVSVIPGMPDYPQDFYKSPFSSLKGFYNPKEHVDGNNFEITSRLKVVGGEEAQRHQFPFQVSIQVRNYFEGYDHNCGGVIYDASHVISAAHCLRGFHHRNLKVIAGDHELFNDEGPEQYRDVLGYVFHPSFDWMTLDNDIGIITLDHPFDLNDKVQPLKLPKEVMENPKIAQTSGWGSNGESDDTQSKLLFVNLTIYEHDECLAAYKNVAIVTDGMLCAGNAQGGKGSCNGDSGGPLICKEPGENGEEYLCGLVSWGMRPCALPNYPTVFTKISAYLDWLHGLLPPQE